jgi:Fur family ferric uptake transcriptional regulator
MKLQTRITSAGLKNTKTRQQVLELLLKENRPIDAAQVFELLKKQDESVDQVTIYRILDIFFQKGLVERLDFQEGKFRYELRGEEHHHLLCEKCGKIEDVSDCGLDVMEKTIKRKKGFLVKHHSLEFFGICRDCQK